MKLLLLIYFILTIYSCGTVTTSKHRCDKLVGVEKEQCLKAYENFVRNKDYRSFRGGGPRGDR